MYKYVHIYIYMYMYIYMVDASSHLPLAFLIGRKALLTANHSLFLPIRPVHLLITSSLLLSNSDSLPLSSSPVLSANHSLYLLLLPIDGVIRK